MLLLTGTWLNDGGTIPRELGFNGPRINFERDVCGATSVLKLNIRLFH